jgi:hypothetical protein
MPQPILIPFFRLLEVEKKEVYQLLVHLWLKSMGKEIFTKQFPLFHFVVFAVIVKSTYEPLFDWNREKSSVQELLRYIALNRKDADR